MLEVISSKLRIVHHNVQGLQSKWLELADWLRVNISSPVVFCFSETWHGFNSPALAVPGFCLFYSPVLPCKSNNSRRPLPGSGMFVADMLLPEHPPICDEIEQLSSVLNITCCFITCVFHKMAVVSIYRSPSTEFSVGLFDLYQILSKLYVVTQYVILAGDFNIDVLNESAAKDQYFNLLSDFQLTQLVDSPSRVTEYSSSLVDHVLCSPSVCVSSVAQATGLSDHRAQIADFAITVQRPPTTC